jgi:hypothetical protein
MTAKIALGREGRRRKKGVRRGERPFCSGFNRLQEALLFLV